MASADRTLTSMTSGDLVPQDVYLVHPTELLEQLPQIVLVHVVRYLTHEHFYVVGIWLLHAVVIHYTATDRDTRTFHEKQPRFSYFYSFITFIALRNVKGQ